MRDLVAGPRRFVELQRVLPGISTEQLRSRLNRMVADGLLTRKRYREVPPRVDYELTERARDLLPTIGALARWGYQWTWSAPRHDEAIDIGAILRSAAGLDTPPGLEGVIELTVVRPDGQLKRYTVELGGGRLTVQERSAPGAGARIRGHERAWVEALTPAGARDSLDVQGDHRLARDLLDFLSPIMVHVAAVG